MGPICDPSRPHYVDPLRFLYHFLCSLFWKLLAESLGVCTSVVIGKFVLQQDAFNEPFL